jgi:hypothetical protein
MCGIVGCVGKIYAKEEEVFKLLSKLDVIRGEHSTGVLSVTKDIGSWETQKMVGTSYDLFATKGFNEMFKRTHLCLFGHNRQATRGTITNDNAHPFAHDHIVGCHNGTLNSMWNLKDNKNFTVDSDNIYYDMSHNGAKKTLEKLNGAFALCWYDDKERTINLVRNEQRPLYYCYTKDHKTFFWASESWMLHVAMLKNDLDRDEIHFLPERQLLTIDVPVVAGSQVEKIEHRQEGVEFYKAPAFREGGSWDSDWYSTSRNRPYAGSTYTTGKTGTEASKETPKKVTNINDKRSSVTLNTRFLGKTIVFSVVGKGKEGNLDHIKCEVEDQVNPPELRVFTDYKGKLGTLLLDSPKMFKGKVKAVSNYGASTYLVCDNRTIEEVPYEEAIWLGNSKSEDHAPLNKDDEEAIVEQSVQDYADAMKSVKYTGFEGKLLTPEEYARNTGGGCALCGDYPSLSGMDKIVWISNVEHFCENCSETQFAIEYLTPSAKNINKV